MEEVTGVRMHPRFAMTMYGARAKRDTRTSVLRDRRFVTCEADAKVDL